MNPRIHITDEAVDEALCILRSARHSTARLAYEKSDREKKVVLARLERESNDKTQRERETYALIHPHYQAFLERLGLIEEEYFAAKDERDSADAVIRAWQTQEASNRMMERLR
jgi:aromatic ring-opening dioxygenase LigB subunit